MRIDGKEVLKMDMKFSAEELKYLEEARKKAICYDEDSPEMPPERAMRFRRVNGVKYYSKWSGKKTVTTKA